MLENNPLKVFQPFRYKTIEDLKGELKKLNLPIPISQNYEILRRELRIENQHIPNRLAIQPMEGFDANLDGSPGDLTIRRYDRFARSGAGVIWIEATAITPEGKSNPHQLYLSENNMERFNLLVSRIRSRSNETVKELGFEGKPLIIIQLNHSGRYSKKDGQKYPIKAYQNPELDKSMGISRDKGIVLSDEELEELEDEWVEKSVIAMKIGFDGVDIKACHGYLISELLSSRGRENSEYGGEDLKNRAKFLFNIFRKLKKRIKNEKDFIITTRFGVYDEDSYPSGFGVKYNNDKKSIHAFDPSEPIKILEKLYNLGVRLVNITAGNPHYKPHITRPFDTPISGAHLPPEHPLYGVWRLINLTSTIKLNTPEDMVIMGSGYSYLRQYAGYICAGLIEKKMIDLCGLGRMAIANPNFPRQIFQMGEIDRKETCITCSRCSELMRRGVNTGCVIRDEYYKNKYKNLKFQ